MSLVVQLEGKLGIVVNVFISIHTLLISDLILVLK